MLKKLKKFIRSLIPLSLILPIYNLLVRLIYFLQGTSSHQKKGLIRLIKKNKEIRLSTSHQIYLEDTLKNFDFYFDGVLPSQQGLNEIVDYSKPSWHEVKDFDLMPVYFNAVSEPVLTTNQYIEFSQISEGSVVIDLGAYSALTSIILDQHVGDTGLVISVEADRDNFISCVKNLSLYEKITKRKIHLINAAIWNHTDGIKFSSEGSMGSSASSVTGDDRGKNIFVQTVTLMSLVNQFNLNKVDFIKCDIEGAESIALNNPEFFIRFKPKVAIECHVVNGVNTEHECKNFMERFGYSCYLEKQVGYPLPLLFCRPN